tara:strand:+ start:686 stop:1375 length:690 start_codon:yes stop_codon:yes gene_type:complete
MLFSNSLERYVRQVLQEQVFGAQAFVYHGSQIDPTVLIPALLKNEYEAGSGDMYGKGLYAVYDLYKWRGDSGEPLASGKSPTMRGAYGQYIYKLKVNLYGFVIFEPSIAQKVYGRDLLPSEQLEMLGKKDLAKQIEKVQARRKPTKGSVTSNRALKSKKILEGKVRGIVFTGWTDGHVVVVYDAGSVVPVSWRDKKTDKWHAVGKDDLRPALRRSALGDFEQDRYKKKK